MMKNRPWINGLLTKVIMMTCMAGAFAPAYAHFQMIIPSDDIVSAGVHKPSDHLFFVEPQPSWEAAERRFIIHYTKNIGNPNHE